MSYKALENFLTKHKLNKIFKTVYEDLTFMVLENYERVIEEYNAHREQLKNTVVADRKHPLPKEFKVNYGKLEKFHTSGGMFSYAVDGYKNSDINFSLSTDKHGNVTMNLSSDSRHNHYKDIFNKSKYKHVALERIIRHFFNRLETDPDTYV